MSFNNDSGPGRSSSGRKRGSLTQRDFARMEAEHREKVTQKGTEEKQEIKKVKDCITLGVKGGLVLLLGIGGICAWPVFCTTTLSDHRHIVFIIPFCLITLIGLVIVIMAGVKFFSLKRGGAGSR
ncbi:MAG: hypothetical protein RDV48_05430 [Candidatus Eremiobacteraeota bacterium]|nr:hypothetical protein [Candidatus Eremiobacteraeota bacterium]